MDFSADPTKPAGTISGHFDFDTVSATVVNVALTYDHTGAVDPRFPAFSADLATHVWETGGLFVNQSDGPDFTDDPLFRAHNAEGFGVVGGTLDGISLLACANAECRESRGQSISSISVDFTSRALAPVPLPAGGALLLGGLLALGALRSRRTAM